MSRSVGAILVLLMAAAQGVSLCACRLEQLIGPEATCGHAADEATSRLEHEALCTGGAACLTELCDSMLQAKQVSGTPWLLLAGVTTADYVPWAEPRAGLPAHLAAGPPVDVPGLPGRTTPLLI